MQTAIKTVTNPTLDANGRFTQAFSQFVAVKNAVVSGSDGYVPHVQAISGNVVTVEVRHYGGASHAVHVHNLLFKDADVADGATSRVNVAADKIGANTGADVTVTSTHGTRGVQNATVTAHAAAVLAALGAGAITAVFRIMAEGI